MVVGALCLQETAKLVNCRTLAGYQRLFDPTLAVLSPDSLRIYFSSSVGLPPMGLDASVNTYSAVSADGLHYAFEPGPRVDVADNKVIDPAVIEFGQGWHYIAPIGAPQQGAYHFVSPDGVQFFQVANIPSDNQHNWTGNYMLNSENELRFYGNGPMIWYNASPNGGVWNGFVATNLNGGDPSVVRLGPDRYFIVFVGAQQMRIRSSGGASANRVVKSQKICILVFTIYLDRYDGSIRLIAIAANA